MLVNPYSSPNVPGDKYHVAEKYIDILLPDFPDKGMLDIHSIISHSDLPKSEKEIASSLYHHITELLTRQFNYANSSGSSGMYLLLNEKGIAAKNAGGHFAYLKQLNDKEALDKERQELNDEKLLFDVKNSKRIFKTYWWTFIFALVSFIYVFIQIVLKILELLKPSLDK